MTPSVQRPAFGGLEPTIDSPRLLTQIVCNHRAVIRHFIRLWHSTHPAPAGWKVSFMAVYKGDVVGVSIWGRPVARLEDQVSTLEHIRMALAPYAPRNTASWFIAQNRKWIRDNMPHVKRIISYIDESNHTGITYRADNWKTIYSGKKNDSNWKSREGRVCKGASFRSKFERTP